MCFCAGVVLTVRRRSKHAIALFAAVLAAVPAILTREGMPDSLRSLLMVVGVFLTAGAGADALSDFLSRKLPQWQPAILAVAIAGLCYEPYHTYFQRWAELPNLALVFDGKANAFAREINALTREIPKYVVVSTGGELAHGIPISAQPIMFLTNTYTARGQQALNIHYLTPSASGLPPEGMTDIEYCRKFAATLNSGALYCVMR